MDLYNFNHLNLHGNLSLYHIYSHNSLLISYKIKIKISLNKLFKMINVHSQWKDYNMIMTSRILNIVTNLIFWYLIWKKIRKVLLICIVYLIRRQ